MENLIYILIIAFALFTVYRYERKGRKQKLSGVSNYAKKRGFKITDSVEMLILDKESRRFFISDKDGFSEIFNFDSIFSFEIHTVCDGSAARLNYPFDIADSAVNIADTIFMDNFEIVEKIEIAISAGEKILSICVLSESANSSSAKFKKAVLLTEKISEELISIIDSKKPL